MDKKRVKLNDILLSLKQIPKTISIIWKIDNKNFFLTILLSIITGFLPVVTLLLSQEIINSLVKENITLNYTLIVFFTYLFVSFIGECISEEKNYITNKLQYTLQYKLSYLIMDRCTNLTLEDFEQSSTYDKIEKLTSEISYRPYQIFISIIGIFSSCVTISSSFILLLLWNPYISIILAIIPIISLLYYLNIGQKEFKIIWGRSKDERKAWYLNYLLTHDFSFKEITMLKLKDYILSQYKSISQKFINQNTSILRKKLYFNIIYKFIMDIAGAVILAMAIISAYYKEILIGNVMTYIRSVGFIQSNSNILMSNIYNIYNGSLYMDILFDFLNQCDNKNKINSIEFKEDINKIVFDNISFSYNNKTKVLKNINLTLKRGEIVALVGANGSGKSTFLKIISGLYNIQQGNIFINNKSIKDINLQDYRSKFSVLFQDFVRYELSLRENIAFGDINNLTYDKRIYDILNKLQLDFLQKEDGSYNLDILLGNWFEGGRQLSQGQWQKIALCRACFKDASVYILDEPNAALDTVTEKKIFEKFFEISKDKIGIFISHHLNVAKTADKIVVLDHGEIVGIGKHEYLLKNCSAYQKLYEAELYENKRVI